MDSRGAGSGASITACPVVEAPGGDAVILRVDGQHVPPVAVAHRISSSLLDVVGVVYGVALATERN